MKKILTAAVVTGVLLFPLSASAMPAAPKAAVPAAPRAAIVSPTHQSGGAVDPAVTPGRGICINIDHDNRITCLLSGKPGGPDCQKRIDVLGLISYWRCGSVSKPPTPAGCENINGDQMFTCFGAAKPSGPCTQTRQLLFIHRYHCSGGGSGRRIHLP